MSMSKRTKLSFETCLKLKEAGMKDVGDVLECGDQYYDKHGKRLRTAFIEFKRFKEMYPTPVARLPFLCELIKACGERFAGVVKYGPQEYKALADQPCIECRGHEPEGNGETPEEAVANLYLKLQKK